MRRLVLGLPIAVAIGCADGAPTAPAPEVVQFGVPAWSSQPIAGDSLLDSLTILLRDTAGEPLPRVRLRFLVPVGTVTPAQGRTSSTGTIRVTWRLPKPNPGLTVAMSFCLATADGACRGESWGLISHTGQP